MPAIGGGAPTFLSSVCYSAPKTVGVPTGAAGRIAVVHDHRGNTRFADDGSLWTPATAGAEDAPLRVTFWGTCAVVEEGGIMQLQHRCTNALFLGLMAIAVATADVTAARAASKNPFAAQSLDLLSDTCDRPLFSPTRRLPPPPPPPVVERIAPPQPLPPPKVVLLGVVTDENGPWAVVRSADKIIRARLGEEIEDGRWPRSSHAAWFCPTTLVP